MVDFMILQVVHLKALLKNRLRTPILPLLRLLVSIRRPNLAFCYDAEVVNDGTGAQIQRVMAIYSLARYLNISYIHKSIKEVSIHPLDPHQTPELYLQYIGRLNSIVELPSSVIGEKSHQFVSEPNLTFIKLIKIIMNSKNSDLTVLFLSDVYSLVDTKVGIYCFAIDEIRTNIDKEYINSEVSNHEISLHYRSVPGGFTIYPGENRTRQLDTSRVAKVLKRVTNRQGGSDPRIKLFTDAPERNMRVPVANFQQHIWEETPGYENGFLYIEGINMREVFGSFSQRIEIIVGGDPINALVQMSRSKTLIMSKSSLSYVACLLNRNQDTYSPLEFWHPVPHSKKF